MRAFVEHDIPQGLGKKSVVILPIGNRGLIISVVYGYIAAWFGSDLSGLREIEDMPTEKDDLTEIILPNDLAATLSKHYDDRTKITPETARNLRDIVLKHRECHRLCRIS